MKEKNSKRSKKNSSLSNLQSPYSGKNIDFYNTSPLKINNPLANSAVNDQLDFQEDEDIGRDNEKNICYLQLYTGLSLFEGRLCCHFSTDF